MGGGGGGGGVCVELGDWASGKLSGGVQLESYSPKLRVLRKFSFQPCYRLNIQLYLFSLQHINCGRKSVFLQPYKVALA